MDKLLYKITVIVLKILPMLLAFITLLNSILSYFNIDLKYEKDFIFIIHDFTIRLL